MKKQNEIMFGFQTRGATPKTKDQQNELDAYQNSTLDGKTKVKNKNLIFGDKKHSINRLENREDEMLQQQQEFMISNMYAKQNSPEPSTSLSHSPPLFAGSGSWIHNSQASQYSRSNQSPATASGGQTDSSLNNEFQSQVSPKYQREQDVSSLGNHTEVQAKKVIRNPFSSQRRKRSEQPTGNFAENLNQTQQIIDSGDALGIGQYQTDNKTNQALKLINPEKFIQQNNFIPVPSGLIGNSQSPGPVINQFSYNSGPNSFAGRNGQPDGAAAVRHPMLMTSPQFFNFFESGENMTRERFAKSREQAKRNKNLTQKQIFSPGPTLNRINTFERADVVGSAQNSRGNNSNLNEQINFNRLTAEQPVQYAPQTMFSVTSKSPFPRRTRVNTQYDMQIEMAASEEQGGSSERSGSNGLNNYLGEGIINVSSEVLNSSTHNINYQEEDGAPCRQPSKNAAPKKAKVPKKKQGQGQRITKGAINFLAQHQKDIVMTPTNQFFNHQTNHSSVESLSPLSPLESENSRNIIQIENQISSRQLNKKKKQNHHQKHGSQIHIDATMLQNESNKTNFGAQRSVSQQKNVLVIPKNMIQPSNQNSGSKQQPPFQPCTQVMVGSQTIGTKDKAIKGKKTRQSTFNNQTSLQLSWTSLNSQEKIKGQGTPQPGQHSKYHGSNGSSSKSPSPSNSNGKISPYAIPPPNIGSSSPTNKSDRSLKHNKIRLSQSPSSDSNRKGHNPAQSTQQNFFRGNVKKGTSKNNLESVYMNNSQLQSLQSLTAQQKQKVKNSFNQANTPAAPSGRSQMNGTAGSDISRSTNQRKRSVHLTNADQNLQNHQQLLQAQQFGFGFGSPAGIAPAQTVAKKQVQMNFGASAANGCAANNPGRPPLRVNSVKSSAQRKTRDSSKQNEARGAPASEAEGLLPGQTASFTNTSPPSIEPIQNRFSSSRSKNSKLQPIENKYNLQFCNPILSPNSNLGLLSPQINSTGINLESSQDHGQLEGESTFMLPPQQMLSKNSANRVLNFNKALNNSRMLREQEKQDR